MAEHDEGLRERIAAEIRALIIGTHVTPHVHALRLADRILALKVEAAPAAEPEEREPRDGDGDDELGSIMFGNGVVRWRIFRNWRTSTPVVVADHREQGGVWRTDRVYALASSAPGPRDEERERLFAAFRAGSQAQWKVGEDNKVLTEKGDRIAFEKWYARLRSTPSAQRETP